MSMINIPAKEPPKAPVISKTVKNEFFIFEFIIVKVIINGIRQARIEDVFLA